MEELKRLLGQTDDEYLIGLCNKGTVKRAYKDLEQETPKAVWNGEGAEVTLKDAVCRIRVPLGNSTCSCPSRSVCRHLITAILYLRQDQETEQEPGPGQERAQEPVENAEQELLTSPIGKLKQACKNRKYREFLEHIKAGELPDIQMGSVITVRLPWEGMTVKLLSPLEYSTCTCHSKELCPHKAQAILAFQLQKQAATLEDLQKLTESGEEWDFPRLYQAAYAMKEGIRLQLLTGLSRLSPEAEESMERLAVISHGAGLPKYEAGLRAAASEYRLYFERAAAFRTEALAERLLFLYRQALRLEQAKQPETVRRLAGTFRDSYLPVPRLHLTAIGGRSFHSKTGYEGETYYFLETDQKKWYTWTDARPTFYEGVRRRPLGYSDKSQAPWGLNCSREQMMELEFFLNRAKATEDGRLSVSQDTKSEVAGARDIYREEISQMVAWDYRKLLNGCFEQSVREKNETENQPGERLALVGAVRCAEGSFDSVRQLFTMELYDQEGRCLEVSVRYSKEEELTIRFLERLSGRLKKQGVVPMVFFGILYLEDGQLRLYPIEFFEGQRFLENQPQSILDSKYKEADGPAAGAGTVKALEEFLLEIRCLCADLFQSGLNSVQEETLSQLRRKAEESEELGLHRAGEELSRIEKALSEKRHQMQFNPEPVLASWGKLIDYLDNCLEKTAFDRAAIEMTKHITGKEESLDAEQPIFTGADPGLE